MVDFMTNDWGQPFTSIDASYKIDPAIFTYHDLPTWNSTTKTFSADGEVRDLPLLGNLEIFYYRKDIYEQLGLSVPKTWDEIVANGQRIQSAGALKYGGAYRLQAASGGIAAITLDFISIMNGVGATFFKDEGKDYTPTADTPEMIKAATILRDLAKTGPAATTTMGQAQAIAESQSGDAGQSYLVTAAAGQMEDPNNSSVVGKMGWAPLPLGPTGLNTVTGTWSLSVPVGLPADRAKAALDYITWVTSKDAQTIFAAKGGVPIRNDYDTSGLSDAQKEYLAATQASAQTASGLFRFPFASEFLTVTEPLLAQIAAGEIEPAAGMQQLQQQLIDVVTKAGVPMGR